MLVEENISETLVKHYSDSGFLIRQVETGILYGEAIDLRPCRYTYEETDEPIDKPEEEEEEEETNEENEDVHTMSLPRE